MGFQIRGERRREAKRSLAEAEPDCDEVDAASGMTKGEGRGFLRGDTLGSGFLKLLPSTGSCFPDIFTTISGLLILFIWVFA